MEVQYLGHSSFRLKGKDGIVITDPYNSSIGLPFPSAKADIVTISHHHGDHDNILAVKAAKEGGKPFVIDQAGEYDIGGITVFGTPTWHDDKQGAERGRNIMFSIFVDDVHVLHLGDLGHTLTEKMVEDIGDVDILLCPVGGKFTIDAQQAIEVISALEPSVVIPMHFRTPAHNAEAFGELGTLEDFLKAYGKTAVAQEKFVYTPTKSEEEVETQLVVLEARNA